MTGDPVHAGAPGSSTSVSQCKGWLVAVGFGLVVGLLLGVGMSGACTHGAWAAAAGVLAGVAGSLVVRLHPVLAGLCSGVVMVLSCLATMTVQLLRSGYWPIKNPETIEVYGTEIMAVTRMAVILLVVACVPCAAAAALVALAKRRVA